MILNFTDGSQVTNVSFIAPDWWSPIANPNQAFAIDGLARASL